MNDNILAVRYAKGYVNSISDGSEDDSLTALNEISNIFLQPISFSSTEVSVLQILTSPAISLNKRSAVFEIFLDRTNASSLLKNFCRILFKKKRLVLLPKICEYTAELINRRTNTITGTVRSPSLPSSAFISEMEMIFSEKHNGHVRLRPEVDPSLIGGVVVRIRDKVYDGSLSNKLNRFIESL